MHAEEGTPVGRRVVLGLIGVGAAGIVTGHWVQSGLASVLGPIAQKDPTGLLSLVPLGDTFRFYSVTGSVPSRTPASYQLSVSGLVGKAMTLSLADLQAMRQTQLTQDFQCVTGWRVPQVRWVGVRLSDLLDRVRPDPQAKAVIFRSFDGTYTESINLAEARHSDMLIALQMLDKPVTHNHGGPVRIYAGSMYGYKSTKWLSAIELTDKQTPGYWETRGYDINGAIKN